eukprot:CAMPEP_0178973092 /NCGR_PEP_ID=MMETSP0789-20121207/21492_1 /TAXON_ID=3005 /ORGANISM="Rhizosolenia setigera, Strain CCMP 1694" /LENGTH=52 /DNA_ID=CAMNT_0020660843 /DNA_START=70 /DNA_END=228 /DNA_ORIENTATION=+
MALLYSSNNNALPSANDIKSQTVDEDMIQSKLDYFQTPKAEETKVKLDYTQL